MSTQMSDVARYAALSELIYRRSQQLDIPILLKNISDSYRAVSVDPVRDANILANGRQRDTDDTGSYVYSPRGFVGEIILDGNSHYIVVFRGVDSTYSGWGSALRNVYAGL
jgi:hypothetical protein